MGYSKRDGRWGHGKDGAMTEPAATSVPTVDPLRALERVDRRAVNRALAQQSPAHQGLFAP